MELNNLSEVEVYLNKVIERQEKNLSIILSGMGIAHQGITPGLLMSVAISEKAPVFFDAVERISELSNFTPFLNSNGMVVNLPSTVNSKPSGGSFWSKLGNTVKDVIPILKGGVDIYKGVKNQTPGIVPGTTKSATGNDKKADDTKIDESTKKLLIYGGIGILFLMVLMIVINLIKSKKS